MFMIVAHHFAIHGGFAFTAKTFAVNELWVLFLEGGGKLGVNIFVLISGFFLCQAPAIKTEKVLKLWIQIVTYSILIFAVFVISGAEPLGIKAAIKSLFPITFPQWWFASTYFVFYLISPYLGRLLRTLTKKEYQRMLVLLTVCWCIIPTFLTSVYESNNLLWFVYLFALSGYIKLHAPKIPIKGKTFILFAVFTFMLTFLASVIYYIAGIKISIFREIYGMQKFPALLASLLLFLGFLKIDTKEKKWVNTISAAMFGVYLIHDHSFVRSFLWTSLFKNSTFSDSKFLIIYSLFAITSVFIFCTLFELLRIHVLEKHYIGLVCRAALFLDCKKKQVFSLKVWDKL